MSNDTGTTSTRGWKIDRNPDDPSAKWVRKQPGPDWPPMPNATGTPDPRLRQWVKDIGEWNLMMHEAVLDLRRRVELLEKGKGK